MTKSTHMVCALSFRRPAHKGPGLRPFYLVQHTALHLRTQSAEEAQGKRAVRGDYNDVMVAHTMKTSQGC